MALNKDLDILKAVDKFLFEKGRGHSKYEVNVKRNLYVTVLKSLYLLSII